MTASEATVLRTALMTQYLAWINAGRPSSYMINGRSKTVDSDWLGEIMQLDNIIARATTGSFVSVQLRAPE